MHTVNFHAKTYVLVKPLYRRGEWALRGITGSVLR
jgi:hypothetical protein